MIVPAAARGVIEQDTLEAMIGPHRPAPGDRQRRKLRPGKMEPAPFQHGTIACGHGHRHRLACTDVQLKPRVSHKRETCASSREGLTLLCMPAKRGPMHDATATPIVTLGLILLTACLVAMLSRRLNLPYAVGLVVAGLALALLPIQAELHLSRDLIFTVLLPPLVFEAALSLHWEPFRRELPATLLLAFAGVAIGATVVAAGAHWLIGWRWIGAALFGALIAATDPVSVVATFRETPVQPRLALLVEAESLLNDGAASVGFAVLVALAAGASASTGAIAGTLVWTIFGGVAAGLAVAAVLMLIAWRTEDPLVEITLTALAAYGSFLIAERIGGSGVLGSLTAGLIVGNFGWTRSISEAGRAHVRGFWDFAAFLANSVVFILIGSEEARQPVAAYLVACAICVPLVLLARALAVYPLSALLRPTALAIDLRHQHVLVWGGLRGALALALALAIPASVAERGAIVVAAFAVVAFSVIVQGLTMPWLVRKLGVRLEDGTRPDADLARTTA